MAQKTTRAATYTVLTEELDTLMRNLEQGDLDIDEAVKCYERGLAIVKELEEHLRGAENKVTELKASTLEEIEEE